MSNQPTIVYKVNPTSTDQQLTLCLTSPQLCTVNPTSKQLTLSNQPTIVYNVNPTSTDQQLTSHQPTIVYKVNPASPDQQLKLVKA